MRIFSEKVMFLEISTSSDRPVLLKATNEWQDDGAGILYQVAQFPIDQVYLIYKAPMPLSTHARPRETRYWLQMQVGLYVPLNPPPLAHRGS